MSPEKFAEQIDLSKLPSGPRVLSRLVALLSEPHVQLSDIATLFRSDAALTARVVRVCNSPFYLRGEPTSDIRDAVLRLGIGEVSRIVEIVAVTELTKHPTHLYRQPSSYFWERSVHTAFVMEELSGGEAEAYTAGIMHLVGTWVLCSVFPPGDVLIDARELSVQAEMEQTYVGLNFAQAGAMALIKWGFATRVSDAVQHQLDSAANAGEQSDLSKLLGRAIAVADWHSGAHHELTLARTELKIPELEMLSKRANEHVARIGLGFRG